ncbi:hypothetical protein RND81_04G120100 [Saponaria officinalis]|uniref:Peptidase A1 domain-containing protein n=1 Tax=Saponaria officinalis TaxID=3572 RepID=A0AAW1LL42_SAPOF
MMTINKLNMETCLHLLFVVLYGLSLTIYSKSANLHLRMIHIDSPDSPIYQPNLTNIERADRLITMSNNRMQTLARKTSQRNASGFLEPNQVPLQIQTQDMGYYVHIGIGQFNDHDHPYQHVFLIFDTASSQIWTQCEGCHPCFRQRYPLFQMVSSQTFRLCRQNECPGEWNQEQQQCIADMMYYGGASRQIGVWSRETFTFTSNNYRDDDIRNVRFVCGMVSYNSQLDSDYNVISGVLGMDQSETSLITQLGPEGGYQFSYCLQDHLDHEGMYPPMYLSFGNHINRPSEMYTTRLINVPGRSSFYYVKLEGISVDGTLLQIPRRLFTIRRDYTGGVILDTGSTYTYLVSDAFDILKDAVATYIENHNNNLRMRDEPNNPSGLEACWEPLEDIQQSDRPEVTFHFQGDADLEVQSSEMIPIFGYPGVVHSPGLYCMTVMRSPHDFNIIGAYQQIDQRFIIDVRRSKVHFAYENCATSSW